MRSSGVSRCSVSNRSARVSGAVMFRSLAVLAWTLGGGEAGAQAETNRTPLALWDISTRVSTGGGYRGNVPLSSVRPQGSSLIEASADFSAIRLSESGSTFTLFVLGELRHYLDIPEIRNEGILYAVTGWQSPIGLEDALGAEFQYLYQNQILDVSETELVQRRVRVLGYGLWLKPYWEHRFNDAWSLKLEGTGLRQIFENDLDDFWEGTVRLRVDYTYGHRSSLSVGYELRHRFYDTRERYDLEGNAEAGTDLVYRYHEVAGEWRHYWDAERRWRTTFEAGFLRNDDNGSGYFNYDRVEASAQLRWREGRWNAKLQGRAGWYMYPNQTVLGDERVRSFYSLDFRVERKVDAHWLLYAAASREWNLSNDPLDQYDDWMATGGLGVEL